MNDDPNMPRLELFKRVVELEESLKLCWETLEEHIKGDKKMSEKMVTARNVENESFS